MLMSRPTFAMNPELNFSEVVALPTRNAPAFTVRRSREIPAYYELSLEDSCGSFARWVISEPIKHLSKRPVLLWLLAPTVCPDSLSWVETGPVQWASAGFGASSNLRGELALGTLRLTFSGQLLHGYYRLHCLPTGGGQLWQLTPICHG